MVQFVRVRSILALAAAVAVVSVAAGACAPAEPSEAPTTPSAAPTSATTTSPPPTASAPTAEVIEVLQPGIVSDEWLILDPATGLFSPTDDHPDSWEASFRRPAEQLAMAFGAQSEAVGFAVDVTKSLEAAASEAGIELAVLNNEFPSTDKPIEVAETAVLQQPDFFFNFLALSAIYPRVQQILAEGQVPNITITLKNPNTPVFGGDSMYVGQLAGAYLAAHASDESWPQAETFVIGCDDLRVGAATRQRIDATFAAINLDLPLIPNDNYVRLDCQDPEQSQATMTNWLTANPQAEYILMTGISDFRVLAMANALRAAGRDATAVGVGHGLDESSKEVIRLGDPRAFAGSVGFFSEDYGRYLIALALDALEGKPIPAFSSPNHVVIDRANIDEYYPG